ncbi:2-dehydropantoate 2-reductase [Motiliproteus sediminis]|uniref:2-dehydropantoate 2-reductase n=1 Tax=Motiliproteus sediminis TaxID=1468178 RepID=UPI001AEFF92E|nr:2-dehydropantoate 2-reductase [Motiliproteus sediminis]
MSQPSTPFWHLLGAGSIGTLFAAGLNRRQCPPRLILRTADQPVSTLTLCHGDQRYRFNAAAETAATDTPIRRLLVTTKAYQSVSALDSIAHRLTPDAVIVVLHNGYGPQQQIAHRWPQLRIYAGTTTEGAYRHNAREVVHAGLGETWLGPINHAAKLAGSAPLAPLLELELGVSYDSEIDTRLWQKLALNAAINGLTVIHDCQNGELARQPEMRAQMAALCAETEAIAQALGQPLFDQPLFTRALVVAEATGSNYSSMLQDVRHGRRTELDSINGTLCQLAEQTQIEAPTHHWLVTEVNRRINGN